MFFFYKQNIIVQAEMLGDDGIFFRVDMTAQKLALTISVLSENSQFFKRLLFILFYIIIIDIFHPLYIFFPNPSTMPVI